MVRTVSIATVLSILVFFSVSFLTFLAGTSSISPAEAQVYQLKIGFPLTFYTQNWVSSVEGNLVYGNWQLKRLFLSCLGYWLVVGGGYLAYWRYQLLVQKERRQKRRRTRSANSVAA